MLTNWEGKVASRPRSPSSNYHTKLHLTSVRLHGGKSSGHFLVAPGNRASWMRRTEKTGGSIQKPRSQQKPISSLERGCGLQGLEGFSQNPSSQRRARTQQKSETKGPRVFFLSASLHSRLSVLHCFGKTEGRPQPQGTSSEP